MENVMYECFHGKLDRRQAEERLGQSGKIGAFLLRESDRKSGSYVLSYYGRSGINHFRITNVYGSYFIGGRQFDTLSDLISYYSSTCDLLADERLTHPVSPPEPVSARDRLFISVLPYTKLAQSDELSFKKGDIFLLQNDLGDGWLWCKDVKTGQSGMIFSQLLEEVQEDIDPNEVFPWFHVRLSKADAVNKLAQAGPGSFLVRPSDNSPGNYTLFYHVGATVQRFLIVKDSENRYTMGGKAFDSLGQIIELYQQEQIIEGHVLQFPVITTLSRADQLSETTLSTSMRALEVREKPQDVYNTVKISREEAMQKQNSEVKGWLGLKKGDQQKKWKNYYFVLNSRDRHLYYYEKPQQNKPKGLIDLSYSFAYEVHESLFDWPQSFLLVEKCLPCFANHFYFRCNDDTLEHRKWIQAIKRFTSLNQSNKKPSQSIDSSTFDPRNKRDSTRPNGNVEVLEEKRSLYLHFLEAQSMKLSQPCFYICYDHDIKVAKTQVKTSPTALFCDDGYFALENIPSDIKTVTISVQQNGKKPKSSLEAPQFVIDLNCLKQSGDQFDRWFKLQPPHSTDTTGCLRLKLLFNNEIILGLSEYAALDDLICDPNEDLMNLMNLFSHRDHLLLSRALSNIYRYKKISARILKLLIEREVKSEMDANNLFKSSSLTTALIESYLRSMCQSILIKCLRHPVTKLLDDKICCELNPIKLESHNVSQKACENFQNLLDLLDEIVCNIYDCVNSYPLPVRYLMSFLQKIVQQKWPNETLVKERAVSGLLFLRLICPTLLNPKQFKLINETPSENAFRNLTLVVKSLQSLANLVETSKSNNSLAQSVVATLDDYSIYPMNQSGPYAQDEYSITTNSILAFILSPQIESWMEVVNPFILKNKIGMVKFVHELCSVDLVDPILIDKPEVDGNNNAESSLSNEEILDPVQDLAKIHGICEKYHKELEQQANSSPAARKLLAILTILSKHKQYYINLKQNSRQDVNTTLV